MKKLVIAGCLFLALTGGQCTASPEKSDRAKSPSPSLRNFDFSSSVLPPRFSGNDPKQVYISLVKKFDNKGEFETSSQYKERIRKSGAEVLFGDVMPSGFISHAIDKDSVGVSYDADAQKFIVSVSVSSRDGYSTAMESGTFEVYSSIRPAGTYEAENGFGAKRIVSKYEIDSFRVLFKDLSIIGIMKDRSSFLQDFRLSFKMTPQKAQKEKENIRVLYIYALREPYVSYAQWRVSPTLDAPKDALWRCYQINSHPVDIWIYNFATGEIYVKAQEEIDRANQIR